jgi:hypothetical protein
MVCTKQLLFTEYGAPLTRKAALMLTDAASQALAGADSGDQGDSVSPSSYAKPAIFESCAGYTSQKYRSCPTGQQVNTAALHAEAASCCRR